METKVKTPTIHDIKYASQKAERYFFSRQTMRAFGDTLRNFGVFQDNGKIFIHRKKPVKHGLTGTWLFNPETGSLTSIRDHKHYQELTK